MNYIEIYQRAPQAILCNGRERSRIDAQYEISRMSGEYEYGSVERRGAVVNAESPHNVIKSCRVTEEEVNRCCESTLRSLGLTAKHDGFSYICLCVLRVLSSKAPIPLMNVYLDIASANGVSASSVERSVRYAIGRIFEQCDKEKISKVYGDADICRENFTSSRFISILALHVYKKLSPTAVRTI